MSLNKKMNSEYDFSQGKRGAVEAIPPGKSRITIRIDDEFWRGFGRKFTTEVVEITKH